VGTLDYLFTQQDYERAAEFYNTCRNSGIKGSKVDFLICAVAVGTGIPIFSSDKTNEITLPMPLVEPLSIKNRIVTPDALHTQRTAARNLVKEKKAHYLFTVKDNNQHL